MRPCLLAIALAACNPAPAAPACPPPAECPAAPPAKVCPPDQGDVVKKARAAEAAANGALDAMATKLAAAEAEIKRLSETPEIAYQQIADAIAAADTGSALGEIEERIAGLSTRFRGQDRSARALTKLMKARRKEIEAAEEERRAREVAEAAARVVDGTRRLMGKVHDGDFLFLATAQDIAQYLASHGLGDYDALTEIPHTSYRAALKDPDAARGQGLRVVGVVNQINKVTDGGLWGGLLCEGQDCGQMVTFVTAGPTNGIFAGSYAWFEGIVLQRYDAELRSEDSRSTIAVVGYFMDIGGMMKDFKVP